jgi:hypothetical protein
MCNTQRRSVRVARAALRRAGYHPERFNRLMIFTEQCEAAASAAQRPGRVSWIRFRSPGMATLVHELGHNLGLEHAYGLVCHQGTRRVALSSRPGRDCRAVEYGDSWDAMGHSRGFFSAPTLVRLGWAGRIARVRRAGTYTLADVEHAHKAYQALRIRAGRTTYWVEYQREHSPQIGRVIPGVMIRRQVGHGPVEIIDASPGNPAGIAYPDRDLTNPALPPGSSLTTPQGIRITTVHTGRWARVQVTFREPSAKPDAPSVAITPTSEGYHVHWTSPPDNGQIVLGYRVIAWRADGSSTSTYVRSPAAYRTSVDVSARRSGTTAPTFTVEALNQDGWSHASPAVAASAAGPYAQLETPLARQGVAPTFDVTLNGDVATTRGEPAPTDAWGQIGNVHCSKSGKDIYSLTCKGAALGQQLLSVSVQSTTGTTTVTIPVVVEQD